MSLLLPPAQAQDAPATDSAAPAFRVPSLLGQAAELGLELNLRFELKADQFRNLRCTTFDRQTALAGCNPGFPTITPNPQYAVRTAGVIAQRLHVNVDFNSEREFDANNNLQVWYEGSEDAILRRIEAGNVTFQTPGSRFISAAIPANNFGVQTVAQLGALELRGIYAQQTGNIVKDRLFTVGETTTQPLDRELRDLDYEQGRFFFAVDPFALPGFPDVDVLEIARETLPDPLRVGGLRVYRLRAVLPGAPGQHLGGVRAVACGVGVGNRAVDCAAQRAGPFQWEILFEGRDYYVDPSGTWFALATRLDQGDYLAVSYVTASGLDSVGTMPVTANPDSAVVDTLRLVYDPRPGVTAAAPSFRFEIRSAYRVGAGELDRPSVELAITVNQRERALTGQTYLELLGLAVANDPNRFDQYSRLFPRERDPQGGAPVGDQFVVFPHLAPFADSSRLTPAERNDSLYRTPRQALVTRGPPSVFALGVHANTSAAADRTTLLLNSIEIREASERIYLGTRLLVRGVDYRIDYAAGTVTFLNADSLLQGGPVLVRAQFEERAAFAVAPTAIYGLAARYDLGERGEVNFTGMFQNEQSAFTRPPLGFEPSSSFIGGVNTRLRFQPDWLTRLVEALPGIRTAAPSFLNVTAEVAVSKPSPNRLGQAYVEEFEGEAARFISLDEKFWHWGSLPCGDPGTACSDGARGALGFLAPATTFAPSDAAALTWQNVPVDAGGAPMQFFPRQIDPTIRITGQAGSAEPVLWLWLHPDTVLGLANDRTGAPNWLRARQDAPRWRSITLTLSQTGLDLSRTEFLEFWVWEDNHRTARAAQGAILFDFGSVFEDAVAFQPTQFSVSGGDTTFFGVRAAGGGRFDTERDPLTRAWNAVINDNGILTDRVTDGILNLTSGAVVDTLPLCDAATSNGQLRRFLFGDLRSRCGRRNGGVDTEDQDGDFVLDSAAGSRLREDFVRYVFPIGDDRYFVRDGGMVPVLDPQGNPDGASGWRLYRIPFRTDTLQVGQPNLRQVQALRLTIVAPQLAGPDSSIAFALARMRLVGSTWLKRTETPVRGIAGDVGTGVGAVVASVVSTENSDLGYTSPPGVTDQADRRDAGLQLGTTQINEQSLRLLAQGLAAGQHAEAYIRFSAAGDKSFLKYRRLRVWARGRGPGWEEGELEFYLKAGKDPNNFYFYHTPARTDSWEPEVVVEFRRWLALRAIVERGWLRGDTAQVYAGCPDTTIVPHEGAFVACDGPYLVYVRNPGTAPPNLASVQELAAGMLRVSENVLVQQAELWVDDIRLEGVVDDAGMAGALDVNLIAGNVADVSLSLYRRDGSFRQLGDDPTYVTDAAAAVATTLHLERFLPSAWGLAAPFSVRVGSNASDPFYLNRSDLRADALDGVRTPRSRSASYALALRRSRRSTSRLGRWLLDPLGLSGSYTTGTARADLSDARSSSYGANLDYVLSPGALQWGPVRVNPSGVRFRSTLVGSTARRATFQAPVVRPSDTLVVPLRSLAKGWRNAGGVDFLPVPGVQLRFDLTSQRDLRDYGDSTTLGRLIRASRRSLFGQDVGIETHRSMTSFVNVTPQISSWVRPRFAIASTFSLTRDPNARQAVREEGDTAGAFRLPVAFGNSRRVDLGGQLDLRRLGQALFPDSGGVALSLARLTPVDLTYSHVVSSTFGRSPVAPSLAYQLPFGGLERLRSEQGVLATSASETATLAGQAAVVLPLGLRINTNYQRSAGLAWVLRGVAQVPVRTRSREWPSVRGTWSLTPGGTVLGRMLSSFSVNLQYRERRTANEPLGTGADRFLSPGAVVNWAGGVMTSFNASFTRNDQTTAGNLVRTSREAWNVSLAFTFRPPAAIARVPSGIRANAQYTSTESVICLRTAAAASCVPVVDSRHTQAQVTLDTEFPPNISAGFQMAYVLNDERQASRKHSQLVITAFVNLTTAVGQLR
ncbi:MAG TPA: cell surface protein SprA [Gemmatimonadales bacterium]